MNPWLPPALRDRLHARLNTLQTKQLFREHTVRNTDLLDFCSNDYLGLSQHPEVKAAFVAGVEEYGVGSGSSHVISGHTQAHHELEQALAELAQQEDAILFSTGYMANIGVLTALCQKEDVILQDRHNHASLIDGGLLSRADMQRYGHHDLDQLKARLAKAAPRTPWIVTDGIFSMEGSFAPLPELCALAQTYEAGLIVDDAHGFGVVGPGGSGSLAHFNCAQAVTAVIGTLGKAFGTAGAFVAGSKLVIENLRQFARTYRYTTAPPPALAAATLKSVAISQQENWRREHLQQLIQVWKEAMAQTPWKVLPSDTPIQMLLCDSSEKALKLSQHIKEKGFTIKAIRPPTVPKEHTGCRITLTVNHTPEQVKALAEALSHAL